MFFILGRKLGETENEKYKNGKEKYTSGGSFLTLVCSLERIVEIMLCAFGWGMKLSSIIQTDWFYIPVRVFLHCTVRIYNIYSFLARNVYQF